MDPETETKTKIGLVRALKKGAKTAGLGRGNKKLIFLNLLILKEEIRLCLINTVKKKEIYHV